MSLRKARVWRCFDFELSDKPMKNQGKLPLPQNIQSYQENNKQINIAPNPNLYKMRPTQPRTQPK